MSEGEAEREPVCKLCLSADQCRRLNSVVDFVYHTSASFEELAHIENFAAKLTKNQNLAPVDVSTNDVQVLFCSGQNISAESEFNLDQEHFLALADLGLSDSLLPNDVLQQLSKLTHLTSLELESIFQLTEAQHSIPQEIGQLTSLARLILDNNNFSGTLPSEIGELAALTKLTIRGNNFSGELPPELSKLNKLVGLTIADSGLSGEAEAINFPPNLQEFHVGGNRLSGALPAFYSNSLKVANFSNNEFSGNLSGLEAELQGVVDFTPALTTILLSGNNLTGELPKNLEILDFLQVLDVSFNNFVGKVPETLGDLASLTSLRLQNNSMNGTIPASLEKLVEKNPPIRELFLLGSNSFNTTVFPQKLFDVSLNDYSHLSTLAPTISPVSLPETQATAMNTATNPTIIGFIAFFGFTLMLSIMGLYVFRPKFAERSGREAPPFRKFSEDFAGSGVNNKNAFQGNGYADVYGGAQRLNRFSSTPRNHYSYSPQHTLRQYATARHETSSYSPWRIPQSQGNPMNMEGSHNRHQIIHERTSKSFNDFAQSPRAATNVKFSSFQG